MGPAEKADKDRVLAFCERMARQHQFRNGDSKSIIESWVTRWHRSK
jgi:hypothetical protein